MKKNYGKLVLTVLLVGVLIVGSSLAAFAAPAENSQAGKGQGNAYGHEKENGNGNHYGYGLGNNEGNGNNPVVVNPIVEELIVEELIVEEEPVEEEPPVVLLDDENSTDSTPQLAEVVEFMVDEEIIPLAAAIVEETEDSVVEVDEELTMMDEEIPLGATELPKTGETSPIVFYLIGLILTLTGFKKYIAVK